MDGAVPMIQIVLVQMEIRQNFSTWMLYINNWNNWVRLQPTKNVRYYVMFSFIDQYLSRSSTETMMISITSPLCPIHNQQWLLHDAVDGYSAFKIAPGKVGSYSGVLDTHLN